MASVDVAIPNYNYGRYLRQCVGSVLDQGIGDLRILIMDNASTDDSVEVAKQLALEDARVDVLTRETNIGLHASLNESIDWAAADYFLTLSADDLLPSGALKRAVAIMEHHEDMALAFGRCLFFHDGQMIPNGSHLHGEPAWRIWEGREFIESAITGSLVTLSPLVRTRIQKKAGYYRPELYSIDYEMWLRLASCGRVAETDAPQVIQRLHQSNISSATWRDPVRRFREAEATLEVFFAHHGSSLRDAGMLHAKGKKSIGKAAYWSAVSHFFRRELKLASRLFRLSVSYCPSAMFLPPFDFLFKYDYLVGRIEKVFLIRQQPKRKID